jgi:hypothetical protein
MHRPATADEQAPDPAAARFVRRVRWLMAISGATTLVAIAAVLGVIGYRLFKQDGRAVASEITALLPKSARIISTAVAEDRIVLTVEINGATEIRTFDLHTLQPAGRLRFATEP